MDVDKLKKTVKVNVDDHSYQKLNEQYKNLLEKKSILENGTFFFNSRQENPFKQHALTGREKNQNFGSLLQSCKIEFRNNIQ